MAYNKKYYDEHKDDPEWRARRTRYAVASVVKRHHIDRCGRIKELINEYEKGATIDEIADKYNVTKLSKGTAK